VANETPGQSSFNKNGRLWNDLVVSERVLILNEIGLQGDYIYIGLRDQESMV